MSRRSKSEAVSKEKNNSETGKTNNISSSDNNSHKRPIDAQKIVNQVSKKARVQKIAKDDKSEKVEGGQQNLKKHGLHLNEKNSLQEAMRKQEANTDQKLIQKEKQKLVYNLLLSITKTERMKAISALCEALKSGNWVPHETDKNIGLYPALCKQLIFCQKDKTYLTGEVNQLCYVFFILHNSPKLLSEESFLKYGYSMITSLSKIICCCISSEDNSPLLEKIMCNASSILRCCSRISSESRRMMIDLEGHLSILVTTLNRSWSSGDIRCNALATIANLALNLQNSEKIANFPDLLYTVIEILNYETVGKLKYFAVVLVLNLSHSPACVEIILDKKEKVMNPLGALLNTENKNINKSCLKIFENITKETDQEIILEKYALDHLLLLFERLGQEINKDNQMIIFRSSKLLLEIAKSTSVYVMVAKNGVIQKIVSVVASSSNVTRNHKILNNAISIIRCLTLSLKSSSDTNFNELIQALMKLLLLRIHVEKILWLFLHQAAKSLDTQIAISSMEGCLESIAKLLLENGISELSHVLVASILLNLSAPRECQKAFVSNRNVISTMIKAAAKDKNGNEDGETKVLLTRAVINLALNKSNKKKLANYSEVPPFLASASTPRKKAYVGARDAIFTLLQD